MRFRTSELEEDVHLPRISPVPLLVDGENVLYQGSSVTKQDLLLLVMAFILRFKLTAKATQGLLDLLNVMVPGCTAKTLHVLEKLFGSNGGHLETHYYCRDSICSNYFGLEVPMKCAKCETVYNGD